ncbi:hypothetical protein I4U23_024164 [Adineta vaga]|nr:hypothetical protein I4U23_024164 [Adineta vaga]
MSLAVPLSPTSSGFHRSHSDRDLLATERRLTRTHLNSSSSSSNLASQSTHTTASLPSSPPSTSTTSNLLPWDRLQKWLYGIAVVTFDLELGQSIEFLLPTHCKLTEKEKLNLSYLAFPDTNSTSLGDFQYHFRLNHESSNLTTYYQLYNSTVPAALQVDNNILFGYANFRQIHDKSIKRGFFQKSFVILSKLPFISLFLTIVQQLARNFFENGLASLEACCHLMDHQWPELEPGKTLLLPLLDTVLQVRIPTHGDKPFSPSDINQFRSIADGTQTVNTNHNQNSTNQSLKFPIDDDIEFDLSSKNDVESELANNSTMVESIPKYEQQLPCLIPYLYDVNTYRSLSCVLTHIQLLWELILLNEPIAILGSFPTKCSQTVQALVHIIWPLRYASDYYPFFTIHNSEFHQITFNSSAKPSQPPKIIIGVTNPFFAKLLHQWPHIIRIDDNQMKSKTKHEKFLLVEHDDDNLSVNELEDSIELSSSPQAQVKVTKKISTTSKPFKPTQTFTHNTSHLTFDMKVGLYTNYKSHLQRDKTILKKLQSTNSQQRPDTVQNAFLRRFFLELTQSFIIPLERYFTSLLPLKRFYQPSRDPPSIKEFESEEFLKTLDQYGPQLTSGLKGNWKDLYRQFLSTPNFRLWLTNRRHEANTIIYCEYIKTIANCRLEQDFNLSKLNELELIDLVIKFKDLIQRLEMKTDERLITIDSTLRNDFLDKLRIKMKLIIDENLSDDMKTLFNKTRKISSST